MEHNLIPEPETTRVIIESEDFSSLPINKLAFFWSCARQRLEKINSYIEDSCNFTKSLDSVFPSLKEEANCRKAILTKLLEDDTITIDILSDTNGISLADKEYNLVYSAEIAIYRSGTPKHIALYSFVQDSASEAEGLEILTINESNLPSYIRHIQSNAKREFREAVSIIAGHKKIGRKYHARTLKI
ncbi:hypothetical protein [Microbulbifer sp. PAAF003]|uniref:hypothetical protein n=1 Tax=Microbulbifer sp. PAAF003 TaxID=3243375 RepID=UPI0040396D0A